MENRNGKVVAFALLSFISLLILSLFSDAVAPYWPLVGNIDILSDVRGAHGDAIADVDRRSSDAVHSSLDTTSRSQPDSSAFQFSQYLQSGQIVDFRSDCLNPSLPRVMEKMAALKRGEKVKIRIAWLGDSLIEGDLITQTVREFLQNEFGGMHGVGFVPFRAVTAGYRTSATAITRGAWRENSFKNRGAGAPLFFSGHVFYSGNGEYVLKDNTVKDSAQVVEKWLYCGQSDSRTAVVVNGKLQYVETPKRFNRILLDKSPVKTIRLKLPAGNLPLYGVSSEPEYGVVIDNLSFRGISGFELGKLDEALLDEIAETRLYDLVVIQYGVNMMFRPKDMNYDYYYKGMMPVVKRLKQHMPDIEFMLVSCADRAFRYGTERKTAIGLDSLLKVQATIAYENRIPFFNLYQSMGGSGTIVRWAENDPKLAAKDYIHASPRGAAILGRCFYDAFKNDYLKLIPAKTQ